ncbi:MAG: clan AA aspartic protease, partial [Cyanothece sp. SIO1E1]|nr:clan AA aspartic protease [Cyanothece sp. SIO1E1]
MSSLCSKVTFLLIGFLLLTQRIYCQKSATLAQQDFLEEIEFEWVRGLIFIPVQIEGKKYRFILDTGGSLSISTAIQEQFSFEQVAVAKVVGINRLSKRVPYVKVPSVRLGSLEFSNYNAIVSDYSRYPFTCLAADGIIGRDFLKDLILELNLPEKKIKLSDNPEKLSPPKKGEIPVKIQRKTSLPYLKVNVEPFGKEWVIFDSGSDDLFSFKTKTIEQLRQKSKFKQQPVETYFGVTSLGSSGVIPKPMAAYTTYIEKLQLGDAVLEGFYADLSKRSRSRVGTGLMKYGIITVDYQ